MADKTFTLQKKDRTVLLSILTGLVFLLVFLLVFEIAQFVTRRPYLRGTFVTTSPAVQDDVLKTTRLALEQSVFQSVNDAIAQDGKPTYSEALDKVLPISKVLSNSASGVVLVLENNGSVSAYHLQIEVTLQIPLRSYKVISSRAFSVTGEDKSKGILKISVDELAAGELLKIALLPAGEYPVLLTASRTEDLPTPALPTTAYQSMRAVEIMATQTAVAVYNQNNAEGLLQFHIEKTIDAIQPSVSVSSDEGDNEFFRVEKNTTEERDAFLEVLQP